PYIAWNRAGCGWSQCFESVPGTGYGSAHAPHGEPATAGGTFAAHRSTAVRPAPGNGRRRLSDGHAATTVCGGTRCIHISKLRVHLHPAEAENLSQYVDRGRPRRTAARDRLLGGARPNRAGDGGLVSHFVSLAGATLLGHRLDSSRGLWPGGLVHAPRN